MTKKKVLHIITHLGVGGAQDNTILTLQKHDRENFEVYLAASPGALWENRARQATDYFYPCPDLAHPISPLKDIKCLWKLASIIRKENIDIVHTHSSKAGILGRLAAVLAKVPFVVHTVHGFAFHDFMPTWKRNFYIFLERSVSLVTDFFLTVSELNRQEAISLRIMSENNSKTVYSGIDYSHLDSTGNSDDLKASLDISPDDATILMVGRLDEQKAPYYLIDAFSKVTKQHPNTQLLFVGDGVLRDRLEAQVESLQLNQKVKFLGSRQDVPHILSICDIFALSSLWEGLGRAMTEAMLVSKPVVVPDIYGIPEIVHHNETGLLYPAKDVNQLAKHISYLLEHPEERQRLGQNAKVLTRRLFSADKMVKDIESIYYSLIESRTSVPREQRDNNLTPVSQSAK